MATSTDLLHVKLAADGFYPRSFQWRGRTVRVLAVHGISTHGAERRYRVRTTIGDFELGLFHQQGLWRIRRQPNWLSRLWARVQRLPRYPLPPWRRRGFCATVPRPVPDAPLMRRAGYADRLALVRQ